MICNKCKVKGHLSRACRGKARVPLNSNPDKGTCVNERTNYNTERNQNDSNSDDEKTVSYVKKISHKKPLEVVIKVDKQDIRFEVDTGSGISLISEATYRNFFSKRKLLQTDVVIKTYLEEQHIVLGEFEVTTVHNWEIYHNLKLYVVSGSGVNLLGRSWLSYITLDWKKLFSGNSCHANKMNVNWHVHEVTSLLNKHSLLFSEQLGTIKGLRATLNVKPDAQPKFYTECTLCTPRSG